MIRKPAKGQFSDLIYKNIKKITPATRKKEYYNVTLADTERYKKVPILTMLLNEDKQKEIDFYLGSII